MPPALCDQAVEDPAGRTRDAVYDRRRVLGVVTVGRGVRWAPEEDALLSTHSVEEVMAATGRSKAAVELRRWSLGIGAKR
ncbi:MAG: hypothetical protein U0744_10395 [Gemmataceae bacterium]